MDTINLKIYVKNKPDLKVIKNLLIKKGYFRSITILEGNDYMKFIMSYPKFYASSNAYLISSAREVAEVNNDFMGSLKKLNIEGIKIEILRVDIPFTIFMHPEDSFDSFKNIFNYFARAYSRCEPKADPKSIMQEITGKKETYIFADKRNAGNYKRKITIYNQSKRFHDCYGNSEFKQIKLENKDVDNRIRIEVSKKITEKLITLDEFENLNLYSLYYVEFVDYILDTLLNEFVLHDLLLKDELNLTRKLKDARCRRNFSYKAFIYENLDQIKSYGIIKESIKHTIKTQKTKEGAMTLVRKTLKEIEDKDGVLIMTVQKKISKIRDIFETLKKNHNENVRTSKMYV